PAPTLHSLPLPYTTLFRSDVSGHRLPFECLDDPFRRDDFTVLTAEGGLAPIGLTNDVPPAAARSHVHLVDRRGVLARAPPPRDEIGRASCRERTRGTRAAR